MNLSEGRKVGGTFHASAEKLSDMGLIGVFLKTLIKSVHMTALGYHVYDVPIALKRQGRDPHEDEGGVTGFAVLSTSHVTLHTWPTEGVAAFDAYSCRDFSEKTVRALLVDFFEAHDLSIYDLTFSLTPKS
jgi:S-adenosylmethionine decarboxylase